MGRVRHEPPILEFQVGCSLHGARQVEGDFMARQVGFAQLHVPGQLQLIYRLIVIAL